MRLLQMVNLKFRPKGKKLQAGRCHSGDFAENHSHWAIFENMFSIWGPIQCSNLWQLAFWWSSMNIKFSFKVMSRDLNHVNHQQMWIYSKLGTIIIHWIMTWQLVFVALSVFPNSALCSNVGFLLQYFCRIDSRWSLEGPKKIVTSIFEGSLTRCSWRAVYFARDAKTL